MLSALLRSGDIKDYRILGQDGITVHSVASQLRNTIALKRGKSFAEHLAIPQRNDSGSHIDWYVPFDTKNADGKYMIIPWTSATEEERIRARAELDVFERTMLDLGKEMNDNPSLKGDQRLFSRLLYSDTPPSSDLLDNSNNLIALRFPNPEHVYIVDGRPVITFWGFLEKNKSISGSPFLQLQPPKLSQSEPTNIISPPIVENKTPWCKRFWWLLPLLLLPLLLLLLLRGCVPVDLNPLISTNPVISNEPVVEDKVKLVEDQTKLVKDKQNYRWVDDHWVDNWGNRVVDPNLIARLGSSYKQPIENQDPVIDPTIPTTEEVIVPDTDEVVEPVDQSRDPATKEMGTDMNISDTEASNNIIDPDDINQNPSSQTPLTIPQSSLNNGNVDFLNGNWNAGAGIQDKKTGKPLRLQYKFNNGQGSVNLTRGDGVKCTGNVQANIVHGGVDIQNTGVAHCTDGTTYQLPNITCSSTQGIRTNCQGEYEQGQKFPISIKSN